MRKLTHFRNAMAWLLGRNRGEADLEDEFQDHMRQEIEENLRAGMTPAEAERAAKQTAGPMLQYKEEVRDARSLSFLENLARDTRYALRTLRRTPLFTAVAIVTLAIGIGANTTVFTFVQNMLLSAPAVADVEQVDTVGWGNTSNISYPNFVDFRDRNNTFSSMAAHRFIASSVGLQARENFRQWGYEVTGNYFDLLGVQPMMGRFFGPEVDNQQGAHPEMVISARYWRNRFNADPQIVGRAIKVNGFPFTIVGVAPESFLGAELLLAGDYWIPLSMEPQIGGNNWLQWRTSQNLWIVGRRKPGVTRAQAEADLQNIAAQLAQTYPNEVNPKSTIRLARVGLVGDDLRTPMTRIGEVLVGVAALGLLLACVNLAGMLLARASDRRREVAIRLALGASRGQLLRQLMTESLLLALTGGLIGFGLAYGACDLLSSWRPAFDMPINVDLHPNLTVLCYTIVAVFATTVLFGLTPALQTVRIDLIPSLKNEPVSVHLRRVGVRDLLVGGQIALSVILVICSVLVVRSLQNALTLKLGFNPERAVAVSFDLRTKGYDNVRVHRLQNALLTKISELPGVESVGIVNSFPLRQDGQDSEFVWPDGQPPPKPSERTIAMVYNISPGYLKAAGTRILMGRGVDGHDRAESPPVALVNEHFGRVLFGDTNVVGKHVRATLGDNFVVEIVGVVEDGKYETLSEDPRPAMFLPLAQSATRYTTVVVRSPQPAQAMTARLRQAVLEEDPDIALVNTGGLKEQMALPLFPARMVAIVLGIFGVFAMALAATGLFALMSYAVARRTREIGVRIALGSSRAKVLSSVMGRALVLCAGGILIGAITSLATGRLLSAVLYGVSPRDPATYGITFLLMSAAALVACSIPALRAIHTDPMRALRAE